MADYKKNQHGYRKKKKMFHMRTDDKVTLLYYHLTSEEKQQYNKKYLYEQFTSGNFDNPLYKLWCSIVKGQDTESLQCYYTHVVENKGQPRFRLQKTTDGGHSGGPLHTGESHLQGYDSRKMFAKPQSQLADNIQQKRYMKGSNNEVAPGSYSVFGRETDKLKVVSGNAPGSYGGCMLEQYGEMSSQKSQSNYPTYGENKCYNDSSIVPAGRGRGIIHKGLKDKKPTIQMYETPGRRNLMSQHSYEQEDNWESVNKKTNIGYSDWIVGDKTSDDSAIATKGGWGESDSCEEEGEGFPLKKIPSQEFEISSSAFCLSGDKKGLGLNSVAEIDNNSLEFGPLKKIPSQEFDVPNEGDSFGTFVTQLRRFENKESDNENLASNAVSMNPSSVVGEKEILQPAGITNVTSYLPPPVPEHNQYQSSLPVPVNNESQLLIESTGKQKGNVVSGFCKRGGHDERKPDYIPPPPEENEEATFVQYPVENRTLRNSVQEQLCSNGQENRDGKFADYCTPRVNSPDFTHSRGCRRGDVNTKNRMKSDSVNISITAAGNKSQGLLPHVDSSNLDTISNNPKVGNYMIYNPANNLNVNENVVVSENHLHGTNSKQVYNPNVPNQAVANIDELTPDVSNNSQLNKTSTVSNAPSEFQESTSRKVPVEQDWSNGETRYTYGSPHYNPQVHSFGQPQQTINAPKPSNSMADGTIWQVNTSKSQTDLYPEQGANSLENIKTLPNVEATQKKAPRALIGRNTEGESPIPSSEANFNIGECNSIKASVNPKTEQEWSSNWGELDSANCDEPFQGDVETGTSAWGSIPDTETGTVATGAEVWGDCLNRNNRNTEQEPLWAKVNNDDITNIKPTISHWELPSGNVNNDDITNIKPTISHWELPSESNIESNTETGKWSDQCRDDISISDTWPEGCKQSMLATATAYNSNGNWKDSKNLPNPQFSNSNGQFQNSQPITGPSLNITFTGTSRKVDISKPLPNLNTSVYVDVTRPPPSLDLNSEVSHDVSFIDTSKPPPNFKVPVETNIHAKSNMSELSQSAVLNVTNVPPHPKKVSVTPPKAGFQKPFVNVSNLPTNIDLSKPPPLLVKDSNNPVVANIIQNVPDKLNQNIQLQQAIISQGTTVQPHLGVTHPSQGKTRLNNPDQRVKSPNLRLNHRYQEQNLGLNQPNPVVSHPKPGLYPSNQGASPINQRVYHPNSSLNHPSLGLSYQNQGFNCPNPGINVSNQGQRLNQSPRPLSPAAGLIQTIVQVPGNMGQMHTFGQVRYPESLSQAGVGRGQMRMLQQHRNLTPVFQQNQQVVNSSGMKPKHSPVEKTTDISAKVDGFLKEVPFKDSLRKSASKKNYGKNVKEHEGIYDPKTGVTVYHHDCSEPSKGDPNVQIPSTGTNEGSKKHVHFALSEEENRIDNTMKDPLELINMAEMFKSPSKSPDKGKSPGSYPGNKESPSSAPNIDDTVKIMKHHSNPLSMHKAQHVPPPRKPSKLVWDKLEDCSIGQFFTNKVYLDIDKTRQWLPSHLEGKHTKVMSYEDIVPLNDLQMAVVINSAWIIDAMDYIVKFPVTVDLTVICPKNNAATASYNDRGGPEHKELIICEQHKDSIMANEQGIACNTSCHLIECPGAHDIKVIHPHASYNVNTNIFLLRYTDKLRFVVFSGSLNEGSWLKVAQFGWFYDFPIVSTEKEDEEYQQKKLLGTSGYTFSQDLMGLLNKMDYTCKYGIGDLFAGVQFDGLSQYVKLITAAPTSPLKESECPYGLPRLHKLRNDITWQKTGTIEKICQTCKMGTGNGMTLLQWIFQIKPPISRKPYHQHLHVIYPSKSYITQCQENSLILENEEVEDMFSNNDKSGITTPYLRDLCHEDPVISHANLLLMYQSIFVKSKTESESLNNDSEEHSDTKEAGSKEDKESTEICQKMFGFFFTGSQTVGYGSWGGQKNNTGNFNFVRYELGIGLFPYTNEVNEQHAINLSDIGFHSDIRLNKLVPYKNRQLPFTPIHSWTPKKQIFYRCLLIVMRDMKNKREVKFADSFQENHPFNTHTDFDLLPEDSNGQICSPIKIIPSRSHPNPNTGSVIEIICYAGEKWPWAESHNILRTFRDKHSAAVYYGIEEEYKKYQRDNNVDVQDWWGEPAKVIKRKKEQTFDEKLKNLGLESEQDIDDYLSKKCKLNISTFNKEMLPHIDENAPKLECRIMGIPNEMQWLENHVYDRCFKKMPRRLTGPYNIDLLQLQVEGLRTKCISGVKWKF